MNKKETTEKAKPGLYSFCGSPPMVLAIKIATNYPEMFRGNNKEDKLKNYISCSPF